MGASSVCLRLNCLSRDSDWLTLIKTRSRSRGNAVFRTTSGKISFSPTSFFPHSSPVFALLIKFDPIERPGSKKIERLVYKDLVCFESDVKGEDLVDVATRDIGNSKML